MGTNDDVELQRMLVDEAVLAQDEWTDERELAETRRLNVRMAALLTATANALKGPPGELKLHDWSDLPAVAERLCRALDDAYGCLNAADVLDLQPETVDAAKAVHEQLWHKDNA